MSRGSMTLVVLIALVLTPSLHARDAVEAAPGAHVATCREQLARTREALDEAKQTIDTLLLADRERVRKLELMIGPVIDELR